MTVRRMMWIGAIAITSCLSLCSAACASKAQPDSPSSAVPRSCASWNALSSSSKTAVALVSCASLDPTSWNVMEMIGPTTCSTAGLRASARNDADDVLDSFVELTDDHNEAAPAITVRPEPRVSTRVYGVGATPAVACDQAIHRVYFGSSFLGFVVALDGRGNELWRSTTPGFTSMIGRLPAIPTPRSVYELLESSGSTITKIVTEGPILAVEYRIRGQYHQAVYHRSGAMIGVIGPWDGIIRNVTEGGLEFAANGVAANGSYKLPTETLTTRLVDPRRTDDVIEHVLAWYLPRFEEQQLTWRKCSGDNRVIRLALGERYDPNLDAIARTIHDGVGPGLLDRVLERAGSRLPVGRGSATWREWSDALRGAFLDAGADVEIARYTEEHHLWPAEGPRAAENAAAR